MGNSQPRPIQKEVSPIIDYSIQFVIKSQKSEVFQYIRSMTTWTQCIEGVMSFAKSLEQDDSHWNHTPVYNLRYTMETRDADICRMSVSWSSECCKEEFITATLKWYVEKELRRCMNFLYGVKPSITLKKIQILGPTSRTLIPVGYEAILRRSRLTNA